MDNMQDILKNYYAQGGKDLFLTEEELNELNIKQLGLGVLAGISLMGAVGKMPQPDADPFNSSGVKPAGYVSAEYPDDYIPDIGSVPPPTNHGKYGGAVTQLAHKAMQAIVEITNKAKAIPTAINWALDMHKRIEVQMYIESIVKGNLEPITKDTVKKDLSSALVTEMQKSFNPDKDEPNEIVPTIPANNVLRYNFLTKILAKKSKEDSMGSFTYEWGRGMQSPTWATLGTSTITITHWQPYQSATVTVYDKYDWNKGFLMSPQGLRESYVDLIRMIFNGDLGFGGSQGAYDKLLEIAEHHAIKVLPDEETSQMLAKEYAKAGKTVTAEELHKYRLVNIVYPASAVFTENQWNRFRDDIQVHQDSIVVVGKRGADPVQGTDDAERTDTDSAGSGDNPVRSKIKDLQDPTK